MLPLGRDPESGLWEYAARGGTDTPWSCGAEEHELADAGNVAELSTRENGAWEHGDWNDGFELTAPVGSFRADPFGLHDVHGNVWEWCLDGYDSGSSRRSELDDPLCEEAPEGERVQRGGAFFFPAAFARSAARAKLEPDIAVARAGLRPARAIQCARTE